MPRTKYPRKTQKESEDYHDIDSIVRDFERKADTAIRKMEANCKMEIKSLETVVDVTISRFPPEIRQMTLGELLGYKLKADNGTENHEISKSSNIHSTIIVTKNKKTKRKMTATSDDGYITEEPLSEEHTLRTNKAYSTLEGRTRSSMRHGRMKLGDGSRLIAIKESVKNRQSKDGKNVDTFKTPACIKPLGQYGIVTPKIKPNTALNILRRPRQGEMVLSMQGSPLLVSAVVQEETANINVPLRDGNMVSLLPNSGLRMSHFPSLDAQTIQQLETLKTHIETVIQNTNSK